MGLVGAKQILSLTRIFKQKIPGLAGFSFRTMFQYISPPPQQISMSLCSKVTHQIGYGLDYGIEASST